MKMSETVYKKRITKAKEKGNERIYQIPKIIMRSERSAHQNLVKGITYLFGWSNEKFIQELIRIKKKEIYLQNRALEIRKNTSTVEEFLKEYNKELLTEEEQKLINTINYYEKNFYEGLKID